MHEKTPASSNDSQPDEFDLIIDGLKAHMEDPYIVSIHSKALQLQRQINTYDDPYDVKVARSAIEHELNNDWRYKDKTIKITGEALIRQAGAGFIGSHMCIGSEVISRGFVCYLNDTDHSTQATTEIGHLLLTRIPETNKLTAVVMPINNIEQIELPEPSPEAREQKFAYYHSDEAFEIDDIVFNAERDDQIAILLGEFAMDIDFDKDDYKDHLSDASEYLKRRAELEPIANYRASVLGEVALLDIPANKLKLANLKAPYEATVSLSDVVLRPENIREANLKGVQKCIPYVALKALEPSGKDIDMLVPCKSILWLYSMRYDDAP